MSGLARMEGAGHQNLPSTTISPEVLMDVFSERRRVNKVQRQTWRA